MPKDALDLPRPCRSGRWLGRAQAPERLADDARDLHLRHADALADLGLREVLGEAQAQHQPLALVEVAAIGVDTASIDYGQSKDFIVHQIANGANVPGLENVANLEDVPETGAWIVALPMKIAGGTGGPLRIIALVP